MENFPEYTVELRAKGEVVVYYDGEREYHLGVDWRKDPPTLYNDTFWDGRVGSAPQALPENSREIILSRIYDFLKTTDGKTSVGVVFFMNPSTGSYDRVSGMRARLSTGCAADKEVD